MEIIKLADIHPASYNPRLLSQDAKEQLKESILNLGCVKPIIVNGKNKTIIAGHQRTKVMKELGMEECFAFVLKDINEADEVRFNQFHNRCEYEINENAPKCEIKGDLDEGYNRISNDRIIIKQRGCLGTLNAQLCRLLSIYGEFGAPICDRKGNVLISSAYAYAAKITGHDIYVYVLPDDKIKEALKYFSKDYGIFSYDKLERNTYMQGLAQMVRLRDGRKGKGNSMHSTLYENFVIPYLKEQGKHLRILDFGAGQMDYAKKLKSLGYDILAVEPYHFKTGTTTIDFTGNKKRFQKVCKDIVEKGLYDVVICDSVLNSVDSMEAHDSVIYTCRALCRIGGKIFMSGRNIEDIQKRENAKTTFQNQGIASLINFFDENGFTALYRHGKWFYQKFHDEAMRQDVLRKLGGDGYVVVLPERKSSFQVIANRTEEVDDAKFIDALKFEWDLMLPNGKRYGLADEIEKAYENRKTDN